MAQIYSLIEVMPTFKDVEFIITAKNIYDQAYNTKSSEAFKIWCDKRENFFNFVPRGIAYSVSQKSFDSYTRLCAEKGWRLPISPAVKALRYFGIALIIGWNDLVDELKKVLKTWGYTAEDIQNYAMNSWLEPKNYDTIKRLITKASESRSILDESIEKHKILNPKLFTKQNELREEVREKILEIVDEFLADLREQDIKIVVDDILFIGSNASYNYTKDSDMDIHILANTKKTKYSPDVSNALYSAYRSLFNKRLDIKIYGIDIEVFVETEESARVSNGVYSVKKDKWIKKPVQEDIPDYDKEALDKLVAKWEEKCKKLLAEADADKLKDETKVLKLIEDIYERLRKKGIAKGEYSIENLAFKELRNKTYLGKLKEYKDILISKRLSLTEKLSRQNRELITTQIAQIAGTKPIIQENGFFFIYNIKASDNINQITRKLKALPSVLEVYSSESSKYDFSDFTKIALNQMPPKYYNIRGKITENF